MAVIYHVKKYYDQYVTVKNFGCKKVITHGKSLVKVVNSAKKKGLEDPVVIFIHNPNSVHIY